MKYLFSIIMLTALCIACSKEEERIQPEWSIYMPKESIEYYLSRQSADEIDMAALKERLTSSEVTCGWYKAPEATRALFMGPFSMRFYFAPDGRCVWVCFANTKNGERIFRLTDDDLKGLKGLQGLPSEWAEWPVGTWRVDGEQRKILLYDLAETKLLADLQIGYYADDRMIATMTYHICNSSNPQLDPTGWDKTWPANFLVYLTYFNGLLDICPTPWPRYLTGEISSMTLSEFCDRYEIPVE